MLFKARKLTALLITLSLLGIPAAEAADLNSVRYHSGSEHDRIVFDWSEMPRYDVKISADKKLLTIDFFAADRRMVSKEAFSSSRIESVQYTEKNGHLLVTLRLKSGLGYKVDKLANPARVFVDILPETMVHDGGSTVQKKPAGGVVRKPSKPAVTDARNMMPLDFDGLYTEMMAPGIAKRQYVYWDDAGKISAYFVEADKNLYTIKPVLAKGRVPGLQTTSGMSDMTDAVAAVNATYFAGNGDAIGMIKIDGDMAGTTYFRRTAIGMNANGQPFMGPVSYSGHVTLGDVTLPVSGVDCERGANNLTIYNHWYGSRTRTNEYGMEYTVVNGEVTAINTGNSVIPKDGMVISVHGTSADAFAGVQVGDRAEIDQDLGARWNQAVDIMGAGPRLVQNGQVAVTAGEEQFPGDIRYGRAPRSAVAILKNGNYLFGVVDGRQSSSRGLTLTDWAKLLVKMGARDAMNLDGGGSSALVIGGQLQNSPSDGSERYVGSALIITKK
ncbi:hypothetical protein SELR_01610 [Selenomonas ruminantium subsp. lactilytica TAM6421]|uniref:Phosphodiester glycosidase domain-containing protein n=1 Tax=Selenomonas ruminantium subsp. lactilytica (strain NBRC 103574 / TAM6421) TaxID=927704 RepID=I0GM82_SELRL|nr:hypothetical protein SELR_01610 [Selenomonas ruminantium subsp. lactilytica TAM6421]